jgi:plasmid stabilization system protein ParE
VSLPIVWSPAAKAEFYAAEQWYGDLSTELAERFAQAVDNGIQTIAQFPLRFPVIHKGKRRAFVRRFPYSLIYLVEDARIVVIACFHGKRNPHHWQRR